MQFTRPQEGSGILLGTQREKLTAVPSGKQFSTQRKHLNPLHADSYLNDKRKNVGVVQLLQKQGEN